MVAGDALVDLTPATTVRGRRRVRASPGRIVPQRRRRSGPPRGTDGFLARLSSDAFGQLLRAQLTDSGVQPTYFVDTDDLTTLAAVHLRGGQATYSFHAAGRGRSRPAAGASAGAGRPAAALHLGSIALVLEPVASTLEGLLRREAGRRVISLDPNVRPGLIADREAYLRRFEGWVPLVDVLKVERGGPRLAVPGPCRPTRWSPAGMPPGCRSLS